MKELHKENGEKNWKRTEMKITTKAVKIIYVEQESGRKCEKMKKKEKSKGNKKMG